MDVTNWLDEHPGGPQALFSHMGRDATEGKFSTRSMHQLHTDTVQNSRCYTMMKSFLNTPLTLSLDVSRARK